MTFKIKFLIFVFIIFGFFNWSGLAFASTAPVVKICGWVGSASDNCAFADFLAAFTSGNTYRGTFYIDVPADYGSAPSLTVVGGTLGNLCQTGGCNALELIQYSGDPGTTWAGQTSFTIIDTQTPVGGSSIPNFDMSTATLAPSTREYFGFKQSSESGTVEAYIGESGTQMNYTSSGGGSSTTSTIDGFGLIGAIGTTTQALAVNTLVPFWEFVLGGCIAFFALFLLAVGFAKGLKRLMK